MGAHDNHYSAAFTRIRDAVAALPVDSAVLDGEAIVLRVEIRILETRREDVRVAQSTVTVCFARLSLSQIRSAHNGDAVRRGSVAE
jgi:hypothetical protein